MRRPVLLIIAICVGVFAVALVAVLLPGPVGAPEEADAIVVFGGGEGERLEVGLDLYEKGAAPPLLLSAGAQDEAAQVGLRCDGSTIICVDPEPLTTAGEARAVAALGERWGWESIVVVTSRHHVRRARTHFDRCLDAEVAIVGARRGFDVGDVYRTAREAIGLLAAMTFDRAC